MFTMCGVQPKFTPVRVASICEIEDAVKSIACNLCLNTPASLYVTDTTASSIPSLFKSIAFAEG